MKTVIFLIAVAVVSFGGLKTLDTGKTLVETRAHQIELAAGY